MNDVKRCPECDSIDTEIVFTEDWSDCIRRTRICNECPTEWVIDYGNPMIESTRIYDG